MIKQVPALKARPPGRQVPPAIKAIPVSYTHLDVYKRQDPNGVSYVVVHDTNLDDAATLYATSLQMIDLVQQINREIKARRVVLVLDTCFSGDALTSLQAGAGGSAARGFSASVPLDKSCLLYTSRCV